MPFPDSRWAQPAESGGGASIGREENVHARGAKGLLACDWAVLLRVTTLDDGQTTGGAVIDAPTFGIATLHSPPVVLRTPA